MSGGPTVTPEGRVVGINVATRRGGQLISFLVPVRFAAALLQRVREQKTAPGLHDEIARQLTNWRSELYKALGDAGFRSTALGPYSAPETMAPWFNCWASTNAGETPVPRASINSTDCTSDTGLFVATDLNVGTIRNRSFLCQNHRSQSVPVCDRADPAEPAASRRRRPVPQVVYARTLPRRLRERRRAGTPATQGDLVRAGLSRVRRTLRRGPGAVTQDHGSEALVSRLGLQAVGYDDAIALGGRFLEAVKSVQMIWVEILSRHRDIAARSDFPVLKCGSVAATTTTSSSTTPMSPRNTCAFFATEPANWLRRTWAAPTAPSWIGGRSRLAA